VAWVRDGIDPNALFAIPSHSSQLGSHWMQLSCHVHGGRPYCPAFRMGTFLHSGCAGQRSWPGR
jgi:hypothetical protein